MCEKYDVPTSAKSTVAFVVCKYGLQLSMCFHTEVPIFDVVFLSFYHHHHFTNRMFNERQTVERTEYLVNGESVFPDSVLWMHSQPQPRADGIQWKGEPLFRRLLQMFTRLKTSSFSGHLLNVILTFVEHVAFLNICFLCPFLLLLSLIVSVCFFMFE